MKALSLSDQIADFIYAPTVAQRFSLVDFVLGCGDLPYYYLEYLVDVLGKPVFFVRGNHNVEVEYSAGGDRHQPWGAVDLHRNVVNHQGLLMAGFQGSLRYRKGPFMYTQGEMWSMVLGMAPRLLWNWIRYGRALDLLATHAPPRMVQDREDIAHQGFSAFRWLLTVFRPRYHFHGHIHVYDRKMPTLSRFKDTLVVNTYGYRITKLYIPSLAGEGRAAGRGAKRKCD